MQAVQHGSLEVQDLAMFAQSCLATLTVAYKQDKLSAEVRSTVATVCRSCSTVSILRQCVNLAAVCRSCLAVAPSYPGKLSVASALLNFQQLGKDEVDTLSALLTAKPLDSVCGSLTQVHALAFCGVGSLACL